MRSAGALAAVAALSIVVSLGCATQGQQSPVVDANAVKASLDSLNQAFTAAVAARDTDAVVAFYADDAHVLPPNAPRADGRDAIRSTWAGFLSMPGLAMEIHSTDVIVAQAGDIAVDVGTYRLTASGPNNQPIQDVGKYVTVLRRVNGQWKIVVDTFNSDLSPTAT